VSCGAEILAVDHVVGMALTMTILEIFRLFERSLVSSVVGMGVWVHSEERLEGGGLGE
jgi:hypothetical protein